MRVYKARARAHPDTCPPLRLQRVRDEFSGRAGAAVDQHHQRHPPGAGAAGRIVEVFVRTAAPRGDHQAPLEKQIGHVHCRREQPTGVATEVDHQRPHARGIESPQGGFEVGCGGLLERGELERRDARSGIEHPRVLDARHLNLLAADRHGTSRRRCPQDGQRDE
jgi:hypothetical protein